jgi:hypothetical protein
MKKNTITKAELKALKASVKHWEKDICKPLREGRQIDYKEGDGLYWAGTLSYVPCYATDCPLCGISDIFCGGCPLRRAYPEKCGRGSYYMRFQDNPTLKNATAMRDALQKIIDTAEVTNG